MVWTGRGGSGCQHIGQQVPGGPSFSWNCHSVSSGGWGGRRGPGLAVRIRALVVCGDTEGPGTLTQEGPGPWEEPWTRGKNGRRRRVTGRGGISEKRMMAEELFSGGLRSVMTKIRPEIG